MFIMKLHIIFYWSCPSFSKNQFLAACYFSSVWVFGLKYLPKIEIHVLGGFCLFFVCVCLFPWFLVLWWFIVVVDVVIFCLFFVFWFVVLSRVHWSGLKPSFNGKKKKTTIVYPGHKGTNTQGTNWKTSVSLCFIAGPLHFTCGCHTCQGCAVPIKKKQNNLGWLGPLKGMHFNAFFKGSPT